jgi:hypothetical protein
VGTVTLQPKMTETKNNIIHFNSAQSPLLLKSNNYTQRIDALFKTNSELLKSTAEVKIKLVDNFKNDNSSISYDHENSKNSKYGIKNIISNDVNLGSSCEYIKHKYTSDIN